MMSVGRELIVYGCVSSTEDERIEIFYRNSNVLVSKTPGSVRARENRKHKKYITID